MIHEPGSMQYLYSIFINLIIYVPPILFAIVLHEVAHGWAALRCGDITAWSQGRLSLNPLCHVDPIGTVLVPTLSLFLFGFIFGWAKPVPVNYYRLRHPKQDMALVALAGPGANLVMAFGWGLVMAIGKIILLLGMPLLGVLLERMGEIGIYTNVFIGVLNMLPIPPLDGSRVLMGVLPDVFGRLVARVEPYGLILIPLLLTTGILNIWPLVVWLYNFIFSFFS